LVKKRIECGKPDPDPFAQLVIHGAADTKPFKVLVGNDTFLEEVSQAHSIPAFFIAANYT
jgi:hypothetical protein